MSTKEKRKADPLTLKDGFEFSISEMEKSIKEHPLDVRYYLYLGKFYNIASEFDKSYLEKAEKTLERALELSPKRQEVYYDLGLTKLLLKKHEEAIEIYKNAISLNEKIEESYWYLGLALLSAEKYTEGLAEIEKAIKMGHGYGEDPNTILFIAQAYANISDYKQAIFCCNMVLGGYPKNINAMAQKTVYLAKSGKKSEAQKLLEEISKINPPFAEELKKVIESL